MYLNLRLSANLVRPTKAATFALNIYLAMSDQRLDALASVD